MSDKYYSDEDGADNTRFGRQQRERDAADQEASQYEGRTVASHQEIANPYGARKVVSTPHSAPVIPGEPIEWKKVDPQAATWKTT